MLMICVSKNPLHLSPSFTLNSLKFKKHKFFSSLSETGSSRAASADKGRNYQHRIFSTHVYLFHFLRAPINNHKTNQTGKKKFPLIILPSSSNSPTPPPPLSLSLCSYTDELKPFVPKLEKSVSGSSPSRDRLLLTVMMLLLAALLIS